MQADTLSKKVHDFILGPVDTDSISFTKADMSPFTEQEEKDLLKEINDISPEFMDWADDGTYKKVIVVRAKNYVLYDGVKTIIRGSSLKASTKCPAMKQFIKDIIQSIIDDKPDYVNLYNSYVKEIMNVTDINRWAVRKTITDKVLAGKRTSELKVLNAIQDSEDEITDGDKIQVYYKSDNSLALVDKFDGDYNIDRLLKNLHDTAKCFETIIDKSMFINYALKRNKTALQTLISN